MKKKKIEHNQEYKLPLLRYQMWSIWMAFCSSYFVLNHTWIYLLPPKLYLKHSKPLLFLGNESIFVRAFSLRYLCDRVVPGNRVTVMGIYSIKKAAAAKAKGKERNAGVGLRSSYLRVVGIQVDTEGAGNTEGAIIVISFTASFADLHRL